MKTSVERLQSICEAAKKRAKTSTGRCCVDGVQFHSCGYAEPGYADPDSGIIALGNWNDVSRYDSDLQKFVKDDNIMPRLADIFSKMGVALEWEDEWTSCDDCGKLVRTSPDSYCWQKSYWEDNEGCQQICHECLPKHMEEYLGSLEGNEQSCATINVALEDHGYRCYRDTLEHGLHSGMDADPKAIATALRKRDVERFIFKLDDSSQFYITFSVWVHEDDWEKAEGACIADREFDGPSPSENMKKALKNAPVGKAPDGKIRVVTCDLSDGSASARDLTPEEFANGALKD